MRRTSRPPVPSRADSDTLLRRAFRYRRRGEHRRAMLTMREACDRDRDSAALWTQYGVQCVRAGRRSEAEQALKQALWLRRRRRDARRVEIIEALLDQVRSGQDVRLAV